MIKSISRLAILNTIVGCIVAFTKPISITGQIADFSFQKWILITWIGLSIVVGLFWWIYMFYHWGTNIFKTKGIKRSWFFILLIGTMFYFIGPLIYYIVVVELGKSLINEKSEGPPI